MKLANWLKRQWASTSKGSVAANKDATGMATREFQLPRELLWLVDAPLYIDAIQVEALYDAILRPDYEGTSVTLSESLSSDTSIGGQLTVGAAIPWPANAEAQASYNRTQGSQHGRNITLTPISNAYRHLFAIAVFYATQLRDRLVLARPAGDRTKATLAGGGETDWLDATFVQELPRALVFLDMEPESKFIPAALEVRNGQVDVVAKELGKAFAKGTEVAPFYRQTEPGTYFDWYNQRFDDRVAIEVIERSVKDSPIAWIDYNVSLDKRSPKPFLHLHVMARGEYPTGVFAYNFVSRGYKYGLRIIGTLKSGPDLNVLAVFER